MHLEEQLSAYLDGELSLEERQQVEEHLAACPACRSLFDELKELQSAFTTEMFGLPEPAGLEGQIMLAVAAENRQRKFEKWGMTIPFMAAAVFILLVIAVGPVLFHFLRSAWTIGKALLYTGSHVLSGMPVFATTSVTILLVIIGISIWTLRRLLQSADSPEMRGDWQ